MLLKSFLINTILITFILVITTSCNKTDNIEKIYLENARQSAAEKKWTDVIIEIQKFIAVEDLASIEDKKNAWILLADATVSLGLIDESIKVLELMVQEKLYSDETLAKIYKKLIRLYDRNEEFEKSTNIRLKFIQDEQIEGDTASKILLQSVLNYQSEGKYKESEKILNIALKKVKDSSLKAEILYYKAYGKAMSKEYDFAYTQLETALKCTPISNKVRGQIYYLLGEMYEWNKEYSTAMIHYKNALDLYPNRMFVQKKINFLLLNYMSFVNGDKLDESD